MKIGITDAGGGMRASYGAGVFDFCLDHDISFDVLVGVSAGSANMASFLAKQRGRAIKYYTDYCFRSEYLGVKAFLKSGNLLNLEYICGPELAMEGGEYPLDYETMISSGAEFLVVATDAKTGKPVYFDLNDMPKNDFGASIASCCVPIATAPYEFHGGLYYDGGLSDPLPFQKAFEKGCDKVVVMITRPRDYYRKTKKDILPAKLLRKYPAIRKALAGRAELYNRQLDEAKNLERQGKVLILAPDSIEGMSTLKRDKGAILKLYEKGMKDAEALMSFMEH